MAPHKEQQVPAASRSAGHRHQTARDWLQHCREPELGGLPPPSYATVSPATTRTAPGTRQTGKGT
ncbi:hypothetical protein ACFQ9D_16400 [Arthrobacter koreensis]|uniref:hypothetical protein n=1 Tax=Arthrobacter koreensis TaxID=199136 RepID=UPI00363374AB